MPVPSEYYRPGTIGQAQELLARAGLGAEPLLFSVKPKDPAESKARALVDLRLLGLDEIRMDEAGTLHIGSLVCLEELAHSQVIQHGSWQMLAEAAKLVAPPGIRNIASLWGCLQEPAGSVELLLALLALDSKLVILQTDGCRVILEGIGSFRQRIPAHGGILLELILPHTPSCGWALERVSRTPRDEAVAAASACLLARQGRVMEAKLALGGMDPFPQRLLEVEEQLRGAVIDDDLLQKTGAAAAGLAQPIGDFRAGREYRRAMASLVVKRALQNAWALALSLSTEVQE